MSSARYLNIIIASLLFRFLCRLELLGSCGLIKSYPRGRIASCLCRDLDGLCNDLTELFFHLNHHLFVSLIPCLYHHIFYFSCVKCCLIGRFFCLIGKFSHILPFWESGIMILCNKKRLHKAAYKLIKFSSVSLFLLQQVRLQM